MKSINNDKAKALGAPGLLRNGSQIGTPRLTSLDFGPQLKLTVNRAAPLSACVSSARVKNSPEGSDEETGLWPLFFGQRLIPPVSPPFPYETLGVSIPPYIHIMYMYSASIKQEARYTDKPAHSLWPTAAHAWLSSASSCERQSERASNRRRCA
jgi:hypothetical protein